MLTRHRWGFTAGANKLHRSVIDSLFFVAQARSRLNGAFEKPDLGLGIDFSTLLETWTAQRIATPQRAVGFGHPSAQRPAGEAVLSAIMSPFRHERKRV